MKEQLGICPYCNMKSEVDLLYANSVATAVIYLACGHEAHSDGTKTIFKDAKTKEVLTKK